MAKVVAGTPPEQRSRLLIAGAVLFAAIAGVLVFVALQNRDGGGTAAATMSDVVVASKDIGVNTRLEEGMLELKSVPADQALTGAYASVERAVGLPVRYPIQRGEQVTTAKVGLSEIEDEKDVGLVLENGERAFSISVEEVTGVGGLPLAGNFVDVIVVWGQEGSRKSALLFQDVEVLSVAQEALEPVPSAADAAEDAAENGETATEEDIAAQGLQGQRPEDVERQPGARTVTLRVTPGQAQVLAVLQAEQRNEAYENVKLWLALRANGDRQILDPPAVDLLQFLSDILLQAGQ